MKIQKFYRTPKLSVEGLEPTGRAGKLEFKEPPLNETFGNKRFYVKDPVQAAALRDLTGTVSLMPMHMNALLALGFDLVQVE